MEKFTVTLPLTGEYLTTVRLTTGGLCSLAGFDVDTAEDYKVCVTESLLILKRSGFTSARIEYTLGEPLLCAICGEERGGEVEEGIDDEISYALLGALLGEVDYTKDEDGKVIAVRFNA